jgi:protein-disulfide isomerase
MARRMWGDLTTGAVILGDSSALPSLTIFTDYSCSFCRDLEPVLDSVITAGIDINAIFIPRSAAPFAVEAAEAVLCADEQSAGHRFHRLLMRSEEWQANGDLHAVALKAELRDIADFTACVDSGRNRARLAWMRSVADSLGVTGTPTLLSPRFVRRGSFSFDEISVMVRKLGV